MAIVLRLMKAHVPVLGLLFEILGGVVSGVWLAVLGEWGAIGYGLAAMIGSHVLVGLVLMPSLLLAVPGRHFEHRNMIVAVNVVRFLARLYFVGVVAVWCATVFAFFMMKANSGSIVPMLVWSFGVATGPWTFTVIKASQEGDDDVEGIAAAFFSQMGYLVMLAMVLGFRATPAHALVVFGAVMLVSLIFQVVTARYMVRIVNHPDAAVL